MIVKTTPSNITATGRFTLADLATARETAKGTPGKPHVFGYTPGGARVELIAEPRIKIDPVTLAVVQLGRWDFTYWISGYMGNGRDISMTR
jgi:hypothetical protein